MTDLEKKICTGLSIHSFICSYVQNEHCNFLSHFKQTIRHQRWCCFSSLPLRFSLNTSFCLNMKERFKEKTRERSELFLNHPCFTRRHKHMWFSERRRRWRRSSLEDEEVKSLKCEVNESALWMSEETPKTWAHHTLPSTPKSSIKLLQLTNKHKQQQP